jgi:hypothetical protein
MARRDGTGPLYHPGSKGGDETATATEDTGDDTGDDTGVGSMRRTDGGARRRPNH